MSNTLKGKFFIILYGTILYRTIRLFKNWKTINTKKYI